ncbi:MAG: TIGR03905 family TSCPD domain-containing protein [Clostridiales bacterium]|nr:TIGR03905 family TSCPD domain-containing protein [Clostridiales bacterium]
MENGKNRASQIHEYRPRGVCSRKITFRMEDGLVRDVRFEGGCSGNTQGVARLVEGMPVEEAVRRLSGIRCGMKSSSCPDQLAAGLAKALEDTAGSDNN